MSKCKYYLEKEVVSYDGGITWNETGVTRKGNLYEESSEDCTDPSVQYRWINMDISTDWICDGTNKYYKQKKQVSYDGIIWQDVTPPEYQRGSIYEINSPDCQPKLQATYSNGQTYYLVCDGNTTLTTGDTRPSGYDRYSMTTAIIGNCVTSIGYGAFWNHSGLTSVIIPNSVTIIDRYAFNGCRSLTGATIPNSVTSIGAHSFQVCSAMTSVIIGNSVTDIGAAAFEDCSSLASVVIPNSVTTLGDSAFRDCSGLTSVTIPNSVTRIDGGAFYGCSSLTNVTIPNSVTSFGDGVFDGCESLTSATIPNSVTSISYGTFAFCHNLKRLNSNIDGVFNIQNGVTTIGEIAFYECYGLTSVIIPNSVTNIDENAFNYCSGLTSVTIPNSVTTIGGAAFGSCSGLTGVIVEATTPPTLGGSRVFNNTNNCPIYVPANSVETYKSASGWSSYSSRIQAIP